MHFEKIEEYSKRNKISLQGGGEDKIKDQHDKGKLTARERIDLLLDAVLLLKLIRSQLIIIMNMICKRKNSILMVSLVAMEQ